MRYKVLLIEPDKNLANQIKQELLKENFFTAITQSAEDAMREIDFSPPDLILLNTNLPDTNSIRFCQSLKQNHKTNTIPIVFLSQNKATVDDVVRGLEVGADDYINSQTSIRELIARLKALIRRLEFKGKIDEKIKISNIELNVREHTLIVRTKHLEKQIQLTTKEFDLLHLLMRKAGKVVNRET
ncbi:MAG: response regulator transcription factor, partial [Elusimicrobiota bacterium]|nr:response regulator transcription factor [Elusimicrobiota bacterium]